MDQVLKAPMEKTFFSYLTHIVGNKTLCRLLRVQERGDKSGSIVKLNNLSGNLLKNMLLLGEIMTCSLGVLINFFFLIKNSLGS